MTTQEAFDRLRKASAELFDQLVTTLGIRRLADWLSRKLY